MKPLYRSLVAAGVTVLLLANLIFLQTRGHLNVESARSALSRLTGKWRKFNTCDKPATAASRASNATAETLDAHDMQVLQNASFIASGDDIEKRRVVMATAATHHYTHFVDNLRCSVRRTTGRDVVLFAFDPVMAEHGAKVGMPTVKAFFGAESFARSDGSPHEWATPGFTAITKLKINAVRAALRSGIDVIFTDVDTAWCVDVPQVVRNFSRRHPDADMLIQNGRMTEAEEAMELNSGFYYAKANAAVLQLFDELVDNAEAPGSGHDQTMFNEMACRKKFCFGNGVSISRQKSGEELHKCIWKNGVVEIRLFPLNTFPNGAKSPDGRSVSRLPANTMAGLCKDEKIAMWHVNYCVGAEKERRLKKQGLWKIKSDGTCAGM